MNINFQIYWMESIVITDNAFVTFRSWSFSAFFFFLFWTLPQAFFVPYLFFLIWNQVYIWVEIITLEVFKTLIIKIIIIIIVSKAIAFFIIFSLGSRSIHVFHLSSFPFIRLAMDFHENWKESLSIFWSSD